MESTALSFHPEGKKSATVSLHENTYAFIDYNYRPGNNKSLSSSRYRLVCIDKLFPCKLKEPWGIFVEYLTDFFLFLMHLHNIHVGFWCISDVLLAYDLFSASGFHGIEKSKVSETVMYDWVISVDVHDICVHVYSTDLRFVTWHSESIMSWFAKSTHCLLNLMCTPKTCISFSRLHSQIQSDNYCTNAKKTLFIFLQVSMRSWWNNHLEV